MARRKPTVSILKPIPTIIGAGITEQYYFAHLQQILGLRVKIRPRFFGHENVLTLEKRIKQVLDDDGFAIVVFDADVSQWNEKERIRLQSLKKRYETKRNVVICDSMPSIEYWFLLHYIRTNRYFGTCDVVIRELVKNMPNFSKHESFLKSPSWVNSLVEKMDKAYENAKSLGTDGESYTNVWKAFRSLKPERFK